MRRQDLFGLPGADPFVRPLCCHPRGDDSNDRKSWKKATDEKRGRAEKGRENVTAKGTEGAKSVKATTRSCGRGKKAGVEVVIWLFVVVGGFAFLVSDRRFMKEQCLANRKQPE